MYRDVFKLRLLQCFFSSDVVKNSPDRFCPWSAVSVCISVHDTETQRSSGAKSLHKSSEVLHQMCHFLFFPLHQTLWGGRGGASSLSITDVCECYWLSMFLLVDESLCLFSSQTPSKHDLNFKKKRTKEKYVGPGSSTHTAAVRKYANLKEENVRKTKQTLWFKVCVKQISAFTLFYFIAQIFFRLVFNCFTRILSVSRSLWALRAVVTLMWINEWVSDSVHVAFLFVLVLPKQTTHSLLWFCFLSVIITHKAAAVLPGFVYRGFLAVINYLID